jgi:hypothetical protein
VEQRPGDSLMIFKDDVIYNVNTKDRAYVAMDRAAMNAARRFAGDVFDAPGGFTKRDMTATGSR